MGVDPTPTSDQFLGRNALENCLESASVDFAREKRAREPRRYVGYGGEGRDGDKRHSYVRPVLGEECY